MARVDGVGKLFKQGVSKVDNFIITFNLQDSQDTSHVSGFGSHVEDHGQGVDSEFMFFLGIGKDGHEVVNSTSHDSIPA